MKNVGKVLSAACVTIGLAAAVSGCTGNVIGSDGPHPGLAAKVGDAEISLDDLTKVTEGVCILTEEDPQATATSREYAEVQLLQAWVTSLLEIEFAEGEGIDASAQDTDLEPILGWDRLSGEQRDAVEEYVEARSQADAIQQAAGKKTPDPADFDITINPRFDIALDGQEFVPAGDQLSVPVSDGADTAIEQPTPEMLQELPDNELCGKRPDPAAGQVPLG